jgi:hypothetical protein
MIPAARAAARYHQGMPDRAAPLPSRRAFLQLAAALPLAAVGCATRGGGPSGAVHDGPSASPAVDPLAALRAMPLPTTLEPALVFRATGGRGRCG